MRGARTGSSLQVMARFRRTNRRAYRRPRRSIRRRRMFRKRSFARRSLGRGNIRIKLTRTDTLAIPLDATSFQSFECSPSDFPEFSNIAPNFEAYRFTKLRARVIPHQNVSNNSTSSVPLMAILPWHHAAPAHEGTTFNDYVSIDKAKIYRQTQAARMTFNMNTLVAAVYDAGGGPTTAAVTAWGKRIELDSDAYKIMHYSGLVAWQKSENAEAGAKSYFTIIRDVWCTLYNQKTLK